MRLNNQKQKKRIQAEDIKYLRRAERITKRNRIGNTEIRKG